MAQLPSIPSIGNDLASHTAALTQIRNILIGIQAAGGQVGAPVQQEQNATLAALIADTLKLNKAVLTPAGGQVGAGDGAWVEIGSGGNIPGTNIPVPAFAAGASNTGGGNATCAFRKLPSGVVLQKGLVSRAGAGNCWTYPAGWLPALRTGWWNVNEVDITAAGVVSISGAGPMWLTGCFFAEQ